MVRQHLQHILAVVARLIAWLIFRGPVVVTAGRIKLILDPRSGRLMPVMAGGAPDGDGDGDGSDGDGDGDAGGDGDDDGDGSDGDDDADGDGDGSDGDDEKDAKYWKTMARKHERRSKTEKKEREALTARLAEIEQSNQSDQEKAIAKAREEAKAEALTEAQQERRADRLEVAVTRLAARGIKVKDGDKEKTVKFADPEDALVFIERAIAKGDLDADDVFDEHGKVNTDAVSEELAELLERKPRLAADSGDGNGGGRGAGESDAGKGKRGGGKELDELSPEEHLKAIQGR